MKSNITYQQILDTFTYIERTPAGGKHYFSSDLDICAVVYRDYAKLFTNRRTEGKYACCFEDKTIVYKEQTKLDLKGEHL